MILQNALRVDLCSDWSGLDSFAFLCGNERNIFTEVLHSGQFVT